MCSIGLRPEWGKVLGSEQCLSAAAGQLLCQQWPHLAGIWDLQMLHLKLYRGLQVRSVELLLGLGMPREWDEAPAVGDRILMLFLCACHWDTVCF